MFRIVAAGADVLQNRLDVTLECSLEGRRSDHWNRVWAGAYADGAGGVRGAGLRGARARRGEKRATQQQHRGSKSVHPEVSFAVGRISAGKIIIRRGR